MNFFRKNVANGFIRLCRIQYDSKLRTQNLYPDHHYKIKYKIDEIYTPGSVGNNDEKIMDLYISKNSKLYLVNNRNFYIKTTETENNCYIDIGIVMNNNYSNIFVEIETVNAGSVKFYCNSDDQTNYTRVDFFNASNTSMLLHKGAINAWTNTPISVTVSNSMVRVSDLINDVNGYVTGQGDLENGNNASFTLSIGSSGDYGRIITITPKRNNYILVECL